MLVLMSQAMHRERKVGRSVPRSPLLTWVAILPGSAAHGWTDGNGRARGPTVNAAAVCLIFL